MTNISENTNRTKITFYFLLKVVIAGLLFFLQWKFPNIDEPKRIENLIKGLWSFLIPSIIVSVIRYIIISVYTARHSKKMVRGNFVLGINRLTVILNVTFIIIAIMFAFGINPVSFLTSMTIVAMALAVTFREYITNMLSGLFIMFSDQLSIGDKIQIDDIQGKIEDITFSSIVLKNEDEDIVTVPNNLVFTHPLINLSAHRSNFFTVRFELPLHVAIHTQELEQTLIKTLEIHPNVDHGFKSVLQVDEIGKDFVKYKIELKAVNSSDKAHKQIENQILKQIIAFKIDI